MLHPGAGSDLQCGLVEIDEPDADGFNEFPVSSSPDDQRFVEFDNGDSSTSGSSYIPAGTYTFQVLASAAWTLSF